jgi:hypothetical protein
MRSPCNKGALDAMATGISPIQCVGYGGAYIHIKFEAIERCDLDQIIYAP